jgi:hypothetical protein
MAAAGRRCLRCLEPLTPVNECICDDEPDDAPDPFAVPFLPPPEPETP